MIHAYVTYKSILACACLRSPGSTVCEATRSEVERVNSPNWERALIPTLNAPWFDALIAGVKDDSSRAAMIQLCVCLHYTCITPPPARLRSVLIHPVLTTCSLVRRPPR
jgi:hypothetical protein